MSAPGKPIQAIVITVRITPKRLEAFHKAWAATGCILPLTVHMGALPSSPIRGCWQSHIDALSSAKGPVLILEDDAVFAKGFSPDIDVPDDAELLYLGGEHVRPTQPVSKGLVKATFVQRSHAYIAYHPVEVAAGLAAGKMQRLDAALAELCLTTYAKDPFTVGQAAGPSLIETIQREKDEFWNGEK
jgi:hypothetical protein